MALPIQLHYQLDRDQTREIYMIVGGKKEKKLYFWMFGFLAFGFLCNILYIITTRTRVGSGQNTFMGADWQSIMSSAFVIVVCVCLALFYHAFSRRRREEMIDLLEQQFSDNTIVLGAESFRYRSASAAKRPAAVSKRSISTTKSCTRPTRTTTTSCSSPVSRSMCPSPNRS